MGSVYSRKRSPYLGIKYHQHGRAVRESTGSTSETVARRMLRAREGDVERGIPIDPKVGRVTCHEAAKDMLNDYIANRKRTYADAKRRIDKHLARARSGSIRGPRRTEKGGCDGPGWPSGVLAASRTISGDRPSGTWSAPASPNAWP